MTHSPIDVTGGPDRIARLVPLHNQHPVPPGVHHDDDQPVPVTVTLRWASGDEQLNTVAVEWWRAGGRDVARVRIADRRVMTGAVWLPADDVRRR